jgi:hypothetical protein
MLVPVGGVRDPLWVGQGSSHNVCGSSVECVECVECVLKAR